MGTNVEMWRLLNAAHSETNKTVMTAITEALVLERIEEQCLERFNAKFPDEMYTSRGRDTVVSKEELISLCKQWLEFWVAERPVSKTPSAIVRLKQKVCDSRINKIKTQADKWSITDHIASYLVI